MPNNNPDNRKSVDLTGFPENLRDIIERISCKKPSSHNFVEMRGQAGVFLDQWYERLCAAGLAHEADLARKACENGSKDAVLRMLTDLNVAASKMFKSAEEKNSSKCEECPHKENCPAKKGLELCEEGMQLGEILEGISHYKINSTEYKVLLQQAKKIAEKAARTEWRGTNAAAMLCSTIKFFSFSKWMVKNAMLYLLECYYHENNALLLEATAMKATMELVEMLSKHGDVIGIGIKIPNS